jgi:single-stranded DNA-binding protein
MNKIMIEGTIADEPKFFSKNGDMSEMLSFKLMAPNGKKQGSKMYVPVCLYGQLADKWNRALHKGMPVDIDGSLRLRMRKGASGSTPEFYIDAKLVSTKQSPADDRSSNGGNFGSSDLDEFF